MEQPKLIKTEDIYGDPAWTFDANGKTFMLEKTRNWTGRGQSYRTAWYIHTTDGTFSAQGGSANKENRDAIIAYALRKTA